MNKRFFYLFGLLAVAVLLGAAACSPRSAGEAVQQQTTGSTDATTDQAVVDDVIVDGTGEEMMEGEDVMMEGTEDETMMEDKGADSAMMDDGGVKSFTLEAGMFYFSSKEITVNKGDTVKITLNNIAGTHDWTIDEFNSSTPQIQAGETATVEFVADKQGSFEYYCSVGNHRQQGMVGTLIVE